MQVTKKYRAGGFFGNSQAKFADMEGAGRGINMAYANRGFLKGKGAALRREKRYLKKLERQGKLNEYGPQSADRLDYLRNVQKDRAKKGVAAGAIAAGLAFGGPAALSALKSGALKGGAAKVVGKGGLKGLMGKFNKAAKVKKALTGSGFLDGMGNTPGSDVYGAPGMSIDNMQLQGIQDFDMAEDDNFDYDASATGPNLQANLAQYGNLPYKSGGKIAKDKTSRDLLKALEAYEGRKKRESVPSITGGSMDDKEILRQLIEEFAKKRRGVQSRPASIMG